MESKITFEIPTELVEFKEEINLPKNYTLFVQELERIAFGHHQQSLPTETLEDSDFYNHHGMSPADYERFVSDMWIGIILTMVMVFIVFALCFWYMYHKFQQWKRNYDARSRMRENATGTNNADLETLPNYTLVSGLPSYDDALEQLRLNSTNHLLINHQTFMKLFGSIKSSSSKHRPSQPKVPSYEDAINASMENSNANNNVLNDVQQCQDNQTTAQPYRSINRFKCTIVPPAEDQFFNVEPTSNANEFPSTIASNQQNLNQLGNSLGSLNIIKEIKNSKPEIPWVHRSASLGYDHEIHVKNISSMVVAGGGGGAAAANGGINAAGNMVLPAARCTTSGGHHQHRSSIY